MKAERISMLSLLQLRDWPRRERVALSLIDGRVRREVTHEELRSRALALSDYLIEQGIGYEDRVAILSEPRPEWVVALFAAARAGAAVIPLDPKLTAEELCEVARDGGPRVAFVSSRCVDAGLRMKAVVPGIEKVILLDQPRQAGTVSCMDELKAERPHRGRERKPEEAALIVYTSGTTGTPKGVIITFANLVFEIESLLKRLPVEETDVFYSMLPLNHLLEFTGGLCSVLYAGAEVCYGPSLLPHEILKIMAEKRVTKMVTVPLFLKLLKRELERAEKKGEGRTMRDRLGGGFLYFISGGAALDPEVEDFFFRSGIPVYQGYGLTECSPVVASNSPQACRFASVGRPLDGIEVRVQGTGGETREGEIQTRGPHVMRGYYRRDDLTRELVDPEGWLRTGDLGRLDGDGYLFVTGRLKDLIVLGNGKKVQPEEVEAALAQSALLKEICVVGVKATSGLLAGTEEICAVVVASEETGARYGGQPELLQEAIRVEIERLGASIAAYKRPSRLVLYPGALPRSVSNKVKRQLVSRWLDQQVAD